MSQGTVKFFNNDKGFGFITLKGEAKDIFFHISGVNGSSIPTDGSQVTFEMGTSKKGPCAVNVELV